MRKQIKIILTIVLIVVVFLGVYYGYQRYNLYKRVQTSDKMMKDKGAKSNNTDKAIVDNMLKNDSDLEYAYISHNDETIMLNLKFNSRIQDKDKYTKLSKYMDKVRAKYKGKNINVTVIPSSK